MCMCVCVGHVDLVDVLISSGANVNLQCADSGLTALMHAASQVLMSGCFHYHNLYYCIWYGDCK